MARKDDSVKKLSTMLPPTRTDLRFGRYKTPRFRLGAVVLCSVRGEVRIVGVSSGRIPWPIGQTKRAKALVIYGALDRAIRKESSVAVCHWWGVTAQTVTVWRRGLGVGRNTDGSRQLASEIALIPDHVQTRAAGLQRIDREAVNAKIAATKTGVPRSEETRARLRAANLGKTVSDEARRKMSEAQRRRGPKPFGDRLPWSAAEDQIIRTTIPSEAARLTNRSLRAVYARRRRLRLRPNS